mmetsp:Transcript_8952/g.16823  ORF Transcript_8952/g.16823 Transcript_8952/m.16823 type:complete len:83 (-) Transcript_8952:307-555(-)
MQLKQLTVVIPHDFRLGNVKPEEEPESPVSSNDEAVLGALSEAFVPLPLLSKLVPAVVGDHFEVDHFLYTPGRNLMRSFSKV